MKGKRVTGFTNGEEEEMHLIHVVPFLVEDELLRLGAIFEKKKDWDPFFTVDGRLITGQNPASSTSTAQAVLDVVAKQPTGRSARLDPQSALATLTTLTRPRRRSPPLPSARN